MEENNVYMFVCMCTAGGLTCLVEERNKGSILTQVMKDHVRIMIMYVYEYVCECMYMCIVVVVVVYVIYK